MNFESLVGRINLIHDALQAQAAHAVNLSLTARNWLVGYYIVEFEQHGEDRAKYGEKLINPACQNESTVRGLNQDDFASSESCTWFIRFLVSRSQNISK